MRDNVCITNVLETASKCMKGQMMKHQFKGALIVVMLCAMVVGMFALAGCAGKGSLSSEINDETGAYIYKADDAGSGSSVLASGGFVVKEGQIVVMSPDMSKGSLQLKLLDSKNNAVLNEKATGRVLSTFEVAPGDYGIGVACNENGSTGSLVVAVVDKAEFEKQNQDLEKYLGAVGQAS